MSLLIISLLNANRHVSLLGPLNVLLLLKGLSDRGTRKHKANYHDDFKNHVDDQDGNHFFFLTLKDWQHFLVFICPFIFLHFLVYFFRSECLDEDQNSDCESLRKN